MRTIIDLPPVQIDALDVWCRRDSISRAEAIRRAVAEALQRRPASDGQRAFGLWARRRVDGVTYQKRVRDEWAVRVPKR